jgi:hypothetical protein
MIDMGSLNTKVEGKIAYYGLVDWWLSTFSESEREYIDNRFQPMNQPLHTLTQGKYLAIGDGETADDVGMFLNGLATWFRSKDDVSILERIHDKIDDLARTQPLSGIGYIRGRYYITYVKDVKKLVGLGELEEAECLLLELISATEQEDKMKKLGVAPWYYEELAKVYRKNKNYAQEVSILTRFAKQRHGAGVKPKQLLERLEKAKLLFSKSKPS